MKNYKLLGKLESYASSCRDMLNTASNHLANLQNKVMVKRIEMLDKELQELRGKVSLQITEGK